MAQSGRPAQLCARWASGPRQQWPRPQRPGAAARRPARRRARATERAAGPHRGPIELCVATRALARGRPVAAASKVINVWRALLSRSGKLYGRFMVGGAPLVGTLASRRAPSRPGQQRASTRIMIGGRAHSKCHQSKVGPRSDELWGSLVDLLLRRLIVVRRPPAAGCSSLDARSWMLDAGCSMLGALSLHNDLRVPPPLAIPAAELSRGGSHRE